MARSERGVIRFIEALLSGAEANLDGDGNFTTTDGPAVRLPEAQARKLASAGVLRIDRAGACRLTDDGRKWLFRHLQDSDSFARQHRLPVRDRDGTVRNLAESPLNRLATSRQGEPFLAPHQLEAGELVRRLVERARLRQRTTMSYQPRTGGSRTGQGADLSDLALDARRRLDDVARILPPDCAAVVFDVCGLLKGLQEVEQERGWPRRSAKLVLRIGLEQLAQHFGMTAEARGPEYGRQRVWVGAEGRPRGVY